MEVISIKGRPWSVGLIWTGPEKRKIAGRKVMVERAASLDPDFDLAAIYRSRHGAQMGFGFAGDNWSRLAKAPALCAALNLPPSFLGLFCMESTLSGDTFWWVHLRVNGVIADYGDMVFSSWEEASDFVKLMENVSGVKAHAPLESVKQSESWISEHLKYGAAARLVFARGQLVNFNQIASRHTVHGLSALAAMLLLCLGVYFGWSHYSQASALEMARTESVRKARCKAELEKHPEHFFEMPWHKKALSTDFAAACLPAMMTIPLAANGWELASASCDGRKVRVEWSHAGGADFTRLPQGAQLDEKDVRTARSSIEVNTAPVKRADGDGTDHEWLLTRDQALGVLAEITQSTGTKLTPPNFKAPKSRTVDKVTIQAPWREGAWELSGVPDLLLEDAGADGISLFAMLAEIPGLGIDSVTFRDGWHIKGTIHAR